MMDFTKHSQNRVFNGEAIPLSDEFLLRNRDNKNLTLLSRPNEIVFPTELGVMVSADEQIICGIVSLKQTSIKQLQPSSTKGITDIDFKGESFCDKRNTLIASTRGELLQRIYLYEYSVASGNKEEIPILSALQLAIDYGIQCIDTFLIIYKRKMQIDTTSHLLIYDLESKKMLVDFTDELGSLMKVNVRDRLDLQLVFNYFSNGEFFISMDGHSVTSMVGNNVVEQKTPPRLMSLNVYTKEVKELYDFSAFVLHKIVYREKEHCSYFNFIPSSIQYDPQTDQLLCLFKVGLFTYDIKSGKGNFELFNEEFISKNLVAKQSAYLFGDHFYFSSDIIGMNGDNHAQLWSLGAFNIRTKKIDWCHHFPEDYRTIGLYAPKANNNYVLAQDAEKRLHVFEKIKT